MISVLKKRLRFPNILPNMNPKYLWLPSLSLNVEPSFVSQNKIPKWLQSNLNSTNLKLGFSYSSLALLFVWYFSHISSQKPVTSLVSPFPSSSAPNHDDPTLQIRSKVRCPLIFFPDMALILILALSFLTHYRCSLLVSLSFFITLFTCNIQDHARYYSFPLF